MSRVQCLPYFSLRPSPTLLFNVCGGTLDTLSPPACAGSRAEPAASPMSSRPPGSSTPSRRGDDADDGDAGAGAGAVPPHREVQRLEHVGKKMLVARAGSIATRRVITDLLHKTRFVGRGGCSPWLLFVLDLLL